jgi:hypothetical protein
MVRSPGSRVSGGFLRGPRPYRVKQYRRRLAEAFHGLTTEVMLVGFSCCTSTKVDERKARISKFGARFLDSATPADPDYGTHHQAQTSHTSHLTPHHNKTHQPPPTLRLFHYLSIASYPIRLNVHLIHFSICTGKMVRVADTVIKILWARCLRLHVSNLISPHSYQVILLFLQNLGGQRSCSRAKK